MVSGGAGLGRIWWMVHEESGRFLCSVTVCACVYVCMCGTELA